MPSDFNEYLSFNLNLDIYSENVFKLVELRNLPEHMPQADDITQFQETIKKMEPIRLFGSEFD